ncbi:prosaposin [Plakobranchus ocellatus]|uniref:Prosaposin n=1 Tax=Plakobranchus ocellatus TaxID=259542 RepID=A0AAV4A1I9_9GAST|nr:prosaposin [Plakobranchus ocellatus]
MEINQLVSMLFNMLDTEMDVQVMCDFLGMCQDDGKFGHTLNELISSSTDAAMKIAEAILPALQQLQKVKVDQGECAVCELIVGQFLNFLKNEDSRTRMLAVGSKFCGVLPKPFVSQCRTIVAQNAVQILDIVIERITPEMACTAALMCDEQSMKKTTLVAGKSHSKNLMSILGAEPETHKEISPRHEGVPVLKVKKERRAPWCDICEEISATVNAFIGSKELERIAISIGDSICMLMPNSLKTTCDAFVRQFFDEFLGDVSSFMTPDFVCGTPEPGLAPTAWLAREYRDTLHSAASTTVLTSDKVDGFRGCGWSPPSLVYASAISLTMNPTW